jgi:hypothetical protein
MRLYGQLSRRSVHRGKSGLCIELRTQFFEVAEHVLSQGRQHGCRTSKASPMPAPRSPRPHARTYENFSRGNWEIPETSLSLERDRSGKGRCHHPDMHVAGKSDSLVVLGKQANKAGPQTAAESVEQRRLTKENGKQLILVRTQSRDFQSYGLFGVRATTQRDRGDLIPMRRDSSISKVGAARRKWGRHRGRSQSPFSPCGSSARTDLCGWRSVMAVTTAIVISVDRGGISDA